jgi:uncharacterized protein
VPVRGAAFLLLIVLPAAPAAAGGGDAVDAVRCRAGAPAAATASAASIRIPRLTGRVVDEAHILSPATRDALTRRSAGLERRTRDQLVVVTLPDLKGRAIEAWGLALGNGWHIGQKGLNNGVLLVVAPNQRKVRIEVGCGLEGLVTNARSAAIIRDPLLPLLKSKRYNAAAEAGVARIAAILERDTRRPQPRREPQR